MRGRNVSGRSVATTIPVATDQWERQTYISGTSANIHLSTIDFLYLSDQAKKDQKKSCFEGTGATKPRWLKAYFSIQKLPINPRSTLKNCSNKPQMKATFRNDRALPLKPMPSSLEEAKNLGYKEYHRTRLPYYTVISNSYCKECSMMFNVLIMY